MKCPAGHDSTASDYCDTCGVAMDPAAAGAGADAQPDATDTGQMPATQPIATGGACPNCSANNPDNALFCESCGYDFTTGALPRAADPITPAAGAGGADSPADAAVDAPADTARSSTPPVDNNPSPAPADQWVAEIWIDPDWYVDQESTDPLPSPGLPTIVPLRHTSILIGRASRSRNITPDIDLATDNGISRRHAQITTDGKRWFVEDLGSSNGTYVGGSIGVLPKDPVPPGQKKEIGADDRIYLGAWTRIVVRKAAPGEY